HLVEMMGGRMELESTPDRGTRISFTLPMSIRRSSEGAASARLGGRRILVLDDNATSREIICSYLTASGALVDTADHGMAGLERLERSAEADSPFALAIIDHLMDDMDGLEFARRCKALCGAADLRLVMLSSIAWIGDMAEVREAGIGRLVQKPVRRHE